MRIYYVCKYAEAQDSEKPVCGMTICSDECKYTSDPAKAKYQNHTEFDERPDGNLWEVMK